MEDQKFTQEERRVALGKAVDAHLALIIATTNENSTRSVTRRWLAWGVTGYILLWGSVAMIFAIMGEKEIVNNMIVVMNALYIGASFLALIVFYFGVQLLRK